MVSKKKLLFLSISLLLMILTGCGKKPTFSSPCYEITCGEEVNFFIVSDPHFISRKTYDHNEAFENFCCTNDGKLLSYADEIMDTLIWEVKNKRPDFLIVSGDLSCNGEKESHLDFAEKLANIEKQGTSVYVIPGNHDIENPWSRNYIGKEPCKTESITAEEFAEIYGAFGYDEAISRDEQSLSYLVTPSEELWLIMLDSTKKNDSRLSNAPEISGMISSKTIKWIEECSAIAKENNAQLIASMHHSLLPHNPLINKGYVIDNSQEVVEVFQKLGIEIVLTGHIHLQSIKSHVADDYRLYDIATGSLLAYPNLYGELRYCSNSGFEYNTQRINVENWAKNNNIIDENLVNFDQYSQNLFKDKSYDKYYSTIVEKLNNADIDNYETMARTVAKLNLGYFKGLRNDELFSTVNITEYNMLMSSLPD